MTAERIKEIIRCGETSTVQFKKLFKTAEDVANELVAFPIQTEARYSSASMTRPEKYWVLIMINSGR